MQRWYEIRSYINKLLKYFDQQMAFFSVKVLLAMKNNYKFCLGIGIVSQLFRLI
jgi:hypothetical protein